MTFLQEVPPRRFELRSSASEANTLSTELQGQRKRFYHHLRHEKRLMKQSPALGVE